MKKSNGFSLVELLIVIAIIGILVSIVMVLTGGGRDRARDSRVQGAMARIRAVAELHYNDNNYNYDTFDSNPEWIAIKSDVDLNASTTATLATSTTSQEYCVYTILNVDSLYYCIDSAGRTIATTTDVTATCRTDGLLTECPN